MELSCSTNPDKFVAIWLKTLVLRTPPKQHQTDPYRTRHGPPACHDSPAASQPAIFTPFTPANPVRIIVHCVHSSDIQGQGSLAFLFTTFCFSLCIPPSLRPLRAWCGACQLPSSFLHAQACSVSQDAGRRLMGSWPVL